MLIILTLSPNFVNPSGYLVVSTISLDYLDFPLRIDTALRLRLSVLRESPERSEGRARLYYNYSGAECANLFEKPIKSIDTFGPWHQKF